MGLPVIELRHVGKRFVIYHTRATSLKERVLRFFSETVVEHHHPEIFWALKDVSLQITAGEMVGLVGPNGSGKSTLLRVIARIFPPTEGEVFVRGRIASLIELGLGFHPELTGEENIYLNASLYGLTRRDIEGIYSDIVEFSELGHFIDTPVKNYSSGMQARLGFSIAVHLDPDILLSDEVLAVGDAAFTRKCLEKMQGFKRSGKTIIFVSHNLEAVRQMCDRAYLLMQGRVVAEGPVGRVIEQYQNLQSVL